MRPSESVARAIKVCCPDFAGVCQWYSQRRQEFFSESRPSVAGVQVALRHAPSCAASTELRIHVDFANHPSPSFSEPRATTPAIRFCTVLSNDFHELSSHLLEARPFDLENPLQNRYRYAGCAKRNRLRPVGDSANG